MYKLLCYNKTNVYTKDRMLFYQNRCSTWPSKFDLHNDIMSNFVSLTSCFLIRTLQDDLRAKQIELKGCESCLNVSVTGWCGYSLLQWTCTHDFYLNLTFFKWAFSYLDIMTAPAPTMLQTFCSSAICTKDSCWRVFIGNLNWPRKWSESAVFGVVWSALSRYVAMLSDSVNLDG